MSSGWRRVAAALGPGLVAIGVLSTLVGVLHVVDAGTDFFGEVAVPMRLVASDGIGAGVELNVAAEPFSGAWVSGMAAGGLPDTDPYSDPLGIVTIHAAGSSLGERLLSPADVLVRGAAVLVAAIALLPVLRAFTTSRPPGAGTARRLRMVALCVLVGGYVGPLLPWLASASVLARLEPVHGMSATPPHHLPAIVAAALVGLLAAAVDGRPGPEVH